MKGRIVKLKEAHRSNGVAAVCSILWDQNGGLLVTASASDSAVLIHDAGQPAKPPNTLRHHRDGVTSIALSPNFHTLASGSVDRSVKLYSFPVPLGIKSELSSCDLQLKGFLLICSHDKSRCIQLRAPCLDQFTYGTQNDCDHLFGPRCLRLSLIYCPRLGGNNGKFQSNVTRFTLPIHALAFNKSGGLLAAAGDDDGIKLIATVDNSISRVLKGHKGSVTGLAFDPKNEFLASIDSFGTVMYWELSSGKVLHSLIAIAPNCDTDASHSNFICWSPDGEILSVPGLRNDVVMYDRDTAEKLFTLKGDHEKPVCFLSWSPNGKYIATSGLDRQVLIWDVDQRQDIDRQKFNERISCLCWKPNANALAVIDVMGEFGVWEFPIPSCMRSPTDGAPNFQSKNSNGLLFFDNDDKNQSCSGSLDEIMEESHGESIPLAHKRTREQSIDRFDEDSDGEDGLLRQIESRKKKPAKRKEPLDETQECSSSISIGRVKMQDAFQPGSTPVQEGKRRFLSYNLLGSITTIQNEGYSHIEVDFHDTGRGPRVPSMTDYFGFTMAALNENGSVFANPCKGDKNMSTLMYRPFGSWANNSEWSMRFEAEEVKAVALGTGWIAAITSLNFLRIFTEGGLQRNILCLDGPVVTAVGSGHKLAVVSHASNCLPSGEQVLEVGVFNINDRNQPIRCRVPLSPGSRLTWFGFSDEGQLCAYDSKILTICNEMHSSSSKCSASEAKKSEDENYWVVGLNESKLFCIVCKSPNYYPSVIPKPVLTLLELKFPLACSDLGADDLENEFITRNLHLSQIQEKIKENSAAGLDTSVLDDAAFDIEAATDRCILRLIASCCNGDKLVRATELARLLSLEKSIKGAIKLVTTLKLPILAERFSEMLEERLLNESNAQFSAPIEAPTDGTRHNVALTSSLPTIESPFRISAIAQSSKQLKNKEHSETKGGVGPSESKGFNDANDQEKSEGKTRKTTEKECNENINNSVRDQYLAGIASNSNEVSHQKQFQRPTNPFVRSSKKLEKSSLFDSIKKMKTDQRKS
ncbi:Flagellar WD repeat-containing protein Pf20 [Apostasia shenzhenica]|uniref:Flagellar WD repeat-containing protein Pf20 n=1 Tax=Apostasia shenzhenica TaxID=1088818 RepID=A0A2H9ZW40_9ASPA|nr:Flagellar WD repeat-containing protein Pf20 [Apostasia shenzhenica]